MYIYICIHTHTFFWRICEILFRPFGDHIRHTILSSGLLHWRAFAVSLAPKPLHHHEFWGSFWVSEANFPKDFVASLEKSAWDHSEPQIFGSKHKQKTRTGQKNRGFHESMGFITWYSMPKTPQDLVDALILIISQARVRGSPPIFVGWKRTMYR